MSAAKDFADALVAQAASIEEATERAAFVAAAAMDMMDALWLEASQAAGEDVVPGFRAVFGIGVPATNDEGQSGIGMVVLYADHLEGDEGTPAEIAAREIGHASHLLRSTGKKHDIGIAVLDVDDLAEQIAEGDRPQPMRRRRAHGQGRRRG